MRCAGSPKRNVGLQGVIEQVDILEHHREIPQQAVHREFTDVVAADTHRPAIDVVEARHKAGYIAGKPTRVSKRERVQSSRTSSHTARSSSS